MDPTPQNNVIGMVKVLARPFSHFPTNLKFIQTNRTNQVIFEMGVRFASDKASMVEMGAGSRPS